MTADDALESLVADVRYRRERYELYVAKMYGSRPTTQTRLRELQRSLQAAEARLAAARSTRRPESADR